MLNMYTSPSTGTSSKPYHRLLHLLLVTGFVCLSIVGTIVSATAPAYADSRPGGNVTDPLIRAVDIAEPAVVRIFTTLGGHLTVHFSSTSSVTFPQSGTGYPLTLSGSGTFITAHGDILTADHVINPPHDQSLDQDLNQTAASDVAAYINQNAKSGSPQVTTNQVTQELDSGTILADRHYDSAMSQVYLSTAYTGPLTAPDFSSLPDQVHAAVDRIEMESSFNNGDVAIVHVNINDVASVQLGDSTSVQPQDQLSIIGFPGNGDVSLTKPTDILTSSINIINVSSIKTTDSGAEVIQVGGNVEHGDSGGPALDSSGSVVGIVSFGLSSSDSPGGTSFLQASNSGRSLVQSLHLNTTPGAFQSAWSRAFADYAASTPGHWHKAEREFANIATSYPLFQAVIPYLAYAQAQAKNEHLPSPSSRTGSTTPTSLRAYALTIGAIAVLLLLVVLLLVLVIRRGGKGKRSSASGAPTATQASQGPVPSAILQQGPGPAAAVQQRLQASPLDDGMVAFGAPPSAMSPSSGPPSVISGTLRPWPCGHMNRPNARYCSICGEPAPPASGSRSVVQ